MKRRSRRSVLAALTAGTTALAGCTGGSSDATTTWTTGTTTTITDTAKKSSQPSTTAQEATTDTETTAAEPDMPTTGPPVAGVEAFDERLPGLMQNWEIPGATVAVARGEDLVFTRGYGYADREAEAVVQPGSLMRVGSISKPITAVAVLDLVERGALSLDDRAVDVLEDLVPEDGPSDSRAADITVRHLLTHTAGWNVREMGYDPMFEVERIADAEGETPPASAEAIVTHVLRQDLSFDPGTAYAYANVGYCFLGRIIEATTGRSYEQYVTDRVLGPLGIERMQIGATRRQGRLEDEVRYHGDRNVESVFPEEGTVPAQYGSFSMQALDAPGGWVASTVDLCRFFRGFDGRSGVTDVLDEDTRATMTERPSLDRWQDASQYYGKGWIVTPESSGPPSLWHNGSLPGSYGYIARDAPNDLTVAALFNARAEPSQLRTFYRRMQDTVGSALGAVSTWPERDLYDRYD